MTIKSPRDWRRDTWILVVGFAALVGVVSLQTACGHVAQACAAVDIAHESCRVIRYLAPDGSIEELTAKDLGTLAAQKKAARAAGSATP